MKNQTKKAISMLLVLVQLFVLFPILQPQAKAAQSNQETPVLNKTIVGNLQYQSFNFLGDNKTGEDGVDYTSTFYYTDDYFARSAINATVSNAKQNWTALEDPSMAACSAAFALASFTTNDKNVLGNTRPSYNNTDYGSKDANAISFLTQCGFDMTTFQQTNYHRPPQQDTIGYVLCSKTIRVWDETAGRNKEYTLVAVGVRGAGYGAEWANNVTIGDPKTNALAANKRHFGFDQSAQTICTAVEHYLAAQHITGEVKYWVAGFSRAAAVANLVAGYLTHDNTKYQTQQKDVFGYTYESPQAASTDENALDYKNIHNILNAMDMVPKVSPTAFGHQRLGVDYAMPYYGNTSAAKNSEYYNRMWDVIRTMIRTDDPLYTAVDPNHYPYNKPLPLYTIDAGQLLLDAGGVGGNSLENFGTVRYTESDQLGGGKWYVDQFIDNLINVFLTSSAWDRGMAASDDPLVHRDRFIQYYQEDFRTLMGYLLDYSGPAFLGLVEQIMDAVSSTIGITNLWNFITNLSGNLSFGVAFYQFWSNDGQGSYSNAWYSLWGRWKGQTYKDVLIAESKTLVTKVINDMVGSYTSRDNITRSQMNSALNHAVELVVELYADELNKYHSQYFGTTLHWLNEILCTHEQETVLSWIMSLDENHMNRSCRTITIPAGCDATVYEYRPQYAQYEGSMDDAEAKAPPVAELENGTLNSKDGRITLYQENGSNVIRYPASLQIRVDVKPNQTIHLNSIAVDDYETRNAYIAVSDGQSQFQNKPLYNTYNTITQQSGKTNAAAKNTDLSGYGTIDAGDTLHVIVNDMQTFNSGDTVYDLIVDKAPDVTVQDYAAGGGLTSGTDAASAVQLGGTASSSTDTIDHNIRTRQTTMTIPASSIYYDDELTTGSASVYEGETTRLDWNAETQESVGKLFWYKFRGTRIDLYCTTDSTTGYVSAEIYENNGGAVGERVDIQAIKSSSDTTRYNVPTISFDGLDANKDYFLRLYAIKGANYRLDGIRVYHAADETDSAVQAAYEAAGEQNAKYVNLHALLLGTVEESTLQDSNTAGALFYTDSGESYALTSDEYQNDSPKNEIYLKHGEKVAFQIVGEYEKVAVGLSAPETKTGGGSVTVTDGSRTKTQSIANALDQYYIIEPASDGSVVVENIGSAMIAITNVKLSGYTPPAFVESAGALRVSKSLMRYAADFSQLPTTAEPEPTPDLGALVRQLISTFVESLFSSISRLFAF